MGNSARDIAGFIHAPSVYLDTSIPKSMTEPENLDLTAANNSHSDDGQVDNTKQRKKKKNERAQRLAAEQAIWVRQKFDLPDTEQLIESFSAALVKSILVQGRIHITSTTICFYAKLFGRTTKEAYPFSQLARVKKRKGGFVANAIKIYFSNTDVPPVVIGSLNHRERAFSIIQDRLREINPGAAESPDADEVASGASATNSHNGESEDRSMDGDEFLPAESESTNGSISGSYRVENGSLRGSRPPLHRTRDVNIKGASSDSSENSSRKSADVDRGRLSRASSITRRTDGPQLVWRTMHDVINRVYGKAYEKKTERARGLLHAPVKEVFNVLFVSDWLKHYHDSTSNRDVTFTEWYRGSDGFMVREVSFRKPLGYKIGPKETRVKETQRYSFTEQGGVIVELEGQNLDAPYGDYFVCESFFELVPQGESATLLIASIAVHFNKSTILRGKIESGALSETKVAFQRLFNLASLRIEEHLESSRAMRAAQKREKSPGAVAPTSPTKKLRSSRSASTEIPSIDVGIPERNVPERTIESMEARPVTEVIPKTAEAMQPQSAILTTPISSAAEPRDSASSRALRFAALSAVITVCVLLIAVLLLLNKLRNDVNALETLVTSMKAGDAAKCVASACATDGTG